MVMGIIFGQSVHQNHKHRNAMKVCFQAENVLPYLCAVWLGSTTLFHAKQRNIFYLLPRCLNGVMEVSVCGYCLWRTILTLKIPILLHRGRERERVKRSPIRVIKRDACRVRLRDWMRSWFTVSLAALSLPHNGDSRNWVKMSCSCFSSPCHVQESGWVLLLLAFLVDGLICVCCYLYTVGEMGLLLFLFSFWGWLSFCCDALICRREFSGTIVLLGGGFYFSYWKGVLKVVLDYVRVFSLYYSCIRCINTRCRSFGCHRLWTNPKLLVLRIVEFKILWSCRIILKKKKLTIPFCLDLSRTKLLRKQVFTMLKILQSTFSLDTWVGPNVTKMLYHTNN